MYLKKIQIRGIHPYKLLTSNLCPGVESLAQVFKSSTGENIYKTARGHLFNQRAMSLFAFISLILFLAHFAFNDFNDAVFKHREFIFFLYALATGMTLVQVLRTMDIEGSLGKFTQAVNDVLAAIMEGYIDSYFAVKQIIGPPEEMEQTVKKRLAELAESILRATPNNETYRIAFAQFKRLHKGAEIIGFKLGGYENFFDPAREKIAQDMQTARRISEAAQRPAAAKT